jgi:predicted dehydrogenase
MKKIVILGCENSHANTFLGYLRDMEEYRDVEVVGVYSMDREAAEKLHETFGVPVMDSFDEAVGKVDGVVITARDGKYHAEFALPYLPTIKAIFVDKPVTVTEEDAVMLMRKCRKHGVKVSGGSCLKYAEPATAIAEDVKAEADGATLAGIARAPVSFENEYGGFFFYSEHLIAMLGEAYGWYPKSVYTERRGAVTTTLFHYPDYTIIGLHTEGFYKYTISRHSEKAMRNEEFPIGGNSPCFLAEWQEFYSILSGNAPHYTEEEIIAPVFILNAMVRSMESGKEEPVNGFTI